MKYHFIGAVKAGKLANGFERGKGSIIHIIESKVSYGGEALCGARPAICWTERELKTATCQKCIRQLRKEVMMSNLLDQISQMKEEE